MGSAKTHFHGVDYCYISAIYRASNTQCHKQTMSNIELLHSGVQLASQSVCYSTCCNKVISALPLSLLYCPLLLYRLMAMFATQLFLLLMLLMPLTTRTMELISVQLRRCRARLALFTAAFGLLVEMGASHD